MLNRNAHLIILIVILLITPATLHVIDKLKLSGVSFWEFYRSYGWLLIGPVIGCNVASAYLLYTNLEATDRKQFDELRRIFRFVVWSEVNRL